MNVTNVTTKILAMLVCGFALASHSAMAEYKAVTKFPVCQLVGGSHGCDGITDPNNLREVLPVGVDETDIKACEAIADNINAMEKFNVDWNCDFPISSNAFLLSKPQWVEITGEEECAAKFIGGKGSNETYEQFCKRVSPKPLYGISYDLDGKEGGEKIYTALFSDFKCGDKKQDWRSRFWTAESDGSSLRKNHKLFYDFGMHNADFVIYSNRLYIVSYTNGNQVVKKGFTVNRFDLTPDINSGIKYMNVTACSIQPIPSASIQEK